MFECKRKAVESFRKDQTQNFRCIAKKKKKKKGVRTTGIRFMKRKRKPDAQKPKERKVEK